MAIAEKESRDFQGPKSPNRDLNIQDDKYLGWLISPIDDFYLTSLFKTLHRFIN